MKQNYFKDYIVLISGASKGIGKELVLAFARQKAKLVLAARNLRQLEEVAQQAFALGGEVLTVKTDITQAHEVDHLLQEIKSRFGRIDLLINNAGMGLYGKWENTPATAHQDLFNLNFFAQVELSRKALSLLRIEAPQKAKKMIINLASIASFWPVPKMGSYCASKAALHAFSNILRIELKKDKIQVLCVYPGIINTGFSSHAPNPEQEKVPEAYKTQGKGLAPQKLANIILRAAAGGKKREYVTLSNRLLIKLYQNLPSLFDIVMQRFN